MTPDGRRAVSASDDQTLRLWDLESGQTLRTLEGHTELGLGRGGNARRAPRRLGFGGQYAAGLGPGERPNAAHARRPYELRSAAVAVTPDGRRAVSASWDDTLRVWDLESGQKIRTLVDHTVWAHSVVVTLEGPVLAVAVTADGRRAVSGSYDNTLRLWDLESGKEIAAFTGESGMGVALSLQTDARLLPATHQAECISWSRRSRRNKAFAQRNKHPAPAKQGASGSATDS